MDPQIKSILTSVVMSIAMAATGWAVNQGVIPSADQSVIANDLVVAVGVVVTGLVGWYKARQQSQTALIKAVNTAPNGVKVVAAVSTSPQVNAPIPQVEKIGAK
jgi:hypothetical protein